LALARSKMLPIQTNKNFEFLTQQIVWFFTTTLVCFHSVNHGVLVLLHLFSQVDVDALFVTGATCFKAMK